MTPTAPQHGCFPPQTGAALFLFCRSVMICSATNDRAPSSLRLHQAFYLDADGDLHPVHIFSNWLVGQGLSSMAAGSSSSSTSHNSSKLRIAEISSVDVFEHRGRLFCNVQQPQLLSVIQPPRASSAFHFTPSPSPSNRHLGT